MFSCGSAGNPGRRVAVPSVGGLRHRAPQVVELPFAVGFALREPRRLGLQRQRRRAAIAVHAVRHQRMAGVEHLFDRRGAVSLLALHHVAAGEHQVVEDRIRGSPLPEQMVALEEGIVTIAGMGDDQRLRRHRVLLHQVRDAGIGVDDDFVGEPLHAAPVGLLVADEFLAVRPVRIADRQSAGRIRVQHLLGRDDLDLVGIGIEARTRRRPPRSRCRSARGARNPSRRRAKGRWQSSLRVLLEELAEHGIDLVAARRVLHREIAGGLGDALVLGPQCRRVVLRIGRGELEVGVVAGRRQQALAEEPALRAGSAPKASPSEACAA